MSDITETDLTKAVLKRWAPKIPKAPRWIVALQVHNAAGARFNRRLDAVILETLPSKGITLHGIEMKTNKADLRRELRNPKKFRDFEPFLDFFSIVVPRGILNLGLLPTKWGAYVLRDNGTLHTLRAPLPLHDDAPAIPRTIMASFCRALVSRSLSTGAVDMAYERGRADGEAAARGEIERLERSVKTSQQAVEAFQEASGVRITRWDAGRIGAAVGVIMRGGLESRIRYAGSIRSVGERLIELADELDRIQKDLADGE